MKIIHIADIHWRGLSRHDEYRESFLAFFEQARELNPDVIYVGGDIVHNKTQGISPELIDCLCWWFNELSDIAPVHVILGNHDGLVLNSDRQDAISPILDAINNENIFLYKDSGVYPVKDFEMFNWCVFSCFDEEGWKDVKPEKEKINIALFHGAVWGSLTDIDWEIDGDVDASFFQNFEFTLLGDIHKRQFLNKAKTIAYPGSTIQQNYGEDTGKGFLFWDIRDKDDFDVSFFEIPHFKPFITIDWQGSVEKTLDAASKYQDESRFRIKSDRMISQTESKRIQYDLKREKFATEVVFKAESSFDASRIQTDSGEFKKENLRDAKTLKRLVRDYYKNSNTEEKNLEKLDSLVDKYLSQISDSDETLRNTRWQINKIRFDNLFSYGADNIINFENLPGITGIFGKNTKGKSSIIGALAYGLYNTTDRGSIKNEHIINSRKNNCIAEVDISVNGEPLRVIRSTQKHQTRKGEIYASTSLNLYKLDSTGEVVEDLSEEQRRETEKVLRKVIGTPEDFKMTSLASQGEMNTFIREKATARKLILTKFLDLNVFEKLHDISRAEYSDIKNKMKNFPDVDWNQEIDDLKILLTDLRDNKSSLSLEISEKRSLLHKLTADLAVSDNPDIVTLSEIEKKKSDISQLDKDLKESISKEKKILLEIDQSNEKIEKIRSVKEMFPIDDLKERLSAQQDLEKTLINLKHEHEKEKSTLKIQERSVKKLLEVPCGDSFPKCKFIKDSHKNKTLIADQKEKCSNILDLVRSARKSLAVLQGEDLEEKIAKYEILSKKQSDVSFDLSQKRVVHNNILNGKKNIQSKIDNERKALLEMKERYVEDESERSYEIRKKIDQLKEEIDALDKSRIKVVEKIARRDIEISRLKKEKNNFLKFKNQSLIYEMFIQAVSKKGIPLQIMMSQLPIINLEISKILQGVTGFTVELEADLDSNSMDVFINYGDSRRVIELASGMEKMMASLAIRVALINVSSLTKTNMLIIDEGFGALDETNIEACTRLLKSFKKWFRNIIIISHVDSIKDAVDNSLEITKKEKDAKVRHI